MLLLLLHVAEPRVSLLYALYNCACRCDPVDDRSFGPAMPRQQGCIGWELHWLDLSSVSFTPSLIGAVPH
jgi:hypothetical protein